jgi:Flp pilus assembly protein TadG
MKQERTTERDRGAVMVELALILPVLLMVMIGIIDFGRAYSYQESIYGAAREGARVLALGQPGQVNTAVNNARGSATVTSITTGGSCPATADPTNPVYATVTVKAKITFGIPFISLGTKTLTATARMLCGL